MGHPTAMHRLPEIVDLYGGSGGCLCRVARTAFDIFDEPRSREIQTASRVECPRMFSQCGLEDSGWPATDSGPVAGGDTRRVVAA